MSEEVKTTPAEQAIDDALGAFAKDVKAATGPGAHTFAQEAIDTLSAALRDLVPALPNVAQALSDAKEAPAEALLGVAAAVVPSIEG